MDVDSITKFHVPLMYREEVMAILVLFSIVGTICLVALYLCQLVLRITLRECFNITFFSQQLIMDTLTNLAPAWQVALPASLGSMAEVYGSSAKTLVSIRHQGPFKG